MALAVIASLGRQVRIRGQPGDHSPRFRASWPEVTRELVGLCPPTQLAVVPVLQNLVAIDGILNSFQRLLQSFQARFERLQRVLRIDVWQPRA